MLTRLTSKKMMLLALRDALARLALTFLLLPQCWGRFLASQRQEPVAEDAADGQLDAALNTTTSPPRFSDGPTISRVRAVAAAAQEQEDEDDAEFAEVIGGHTARLLRMDRILGDLQRVRKRHDELAREALAVGLEANASVAALSPSCTSTSRRTGTAATAEGLDITSGPSLYGLPTSASSGTLSIVAGSSSIILEGGPSPASPDLAPSRPPAHALAIISSEDDMNATMGQAENYGEEHLEEDDLQIDVVAGGAAHDDTVTCVPMNTTTTDDVDHTTAVRDNSPVSGEEPVDLAFPVSPEIPRRSYPRFRRDARRLSFRALCEARVERLRLIEEEQGRLSEEERALEEEMESIRSQVLDMRAARTGDHDVQRREGGHQGHVATDGQGHEANTEDGTAQASREVGTAEASRAQVEHIEENLQPHVRISSRNAESEEQQHSETSTSGGVATPSLSPEAIGGTALLFRNHVLLSTRPTAAASTPTTSVARGSRENVENQQGELENWDGWEGPEYWDGWLEDEDEEEEDEDEDEDSEEDDEYLDERIYSPERASGEEPPGSTPMEEDTGAGAGSAQGANQANAGQETGAETGPGRIQIHQYVEDNSSLCEVIVGETGITTCGLEKWMTAVRDSVAALMGSRVVIPDDMMQGFARNRIHQLLVDKLPVREILCRPGGSVTTTSAENEVAMLTGDSCAKCLICQQELQSGETRSRGQSCHLLSCTDDLRPRGTATGKAGVQQETGEYCEVFCDCGKFFHRDCLKRWVVPNKNCPWCRGKIIRVLTLLGDDADEVFGSGVRVGGSETAGDSRSWIACELPSDFLPSTSRSDPEQQPASSSSGQQAASSSVVAPSDLMHDDMVTGSSSITHPSNDPSPSSRTSSGASSTGGDLRGGPSSSSSRTALAENLGALVSSRSQASRPSSNQGSRPSSSFSRPFFVTPPPADTEASGSEDEEQPVDTWSTVPAWILGMMGGTARERERANGGFMADSARTPGDETLTHDGIRTDIEGMAQQARRAIAPSTNSSHRSDARAPPGGLSQIEASPCEYLPDTQELFGTESELEEPTHGTESCPSLPGHGYDAESQPCAVQ